MSALWTRVPDAIRPHLAFRCPRFGLRAAACLAVLSMPGCASFSPDRGMSGVNAVTAPALSDDAVALRTPEDDEAAHARVRALLGRPLTASAAVRIALINNRDLQAAYNALGISEAATVQASLPPSPTFSLSRIGANGAFEIEARIVASILNLANTASARRGRAGSLPAGAVAGRAGNAANGQRGAPRLLRRGRRPCAGVAARGGARDR
jgi:hypothetical protein